MNRHLITHHSRCGETREWVRLSPNQVKLTAYNTPQWRYMGSMEKIDVMDVEGGPFISRGSVVRLGPDKVRIITIHPPCSRSSMEDHALEFIFEIEDVD